MDWVLSTLEVWPPLNLHNNPTGRVTMTPIWWGSCAQSSQGTCSHSWWPAEWNGPKQLGCRAYIRAPVHCTRQWTPAQQEPPLRHTAHTTVWSRGLMSSQGKEEEELQEKTEKQRQRGGPQRRKREKTKDKMQRDTQKNKDRKRSNFLKISPFETLWLKYKCLEEIRVWTKCNHG